MHNYAIFIAYLDTFGRDSTGQELFIGAPGHFARGNSSRAAVGAIYSASRGHLKSVLSGTEPHGRFGHSCAILGSKLAVGQPGKSKKARYFMGVDHRSPSYLTSLHLTSV